MVSLYSTIKMMHGPINISNTPSVCYVPYRCSIYAPFVILQTSTRGAKMADKEVPRNIEEALNELVKTTDKGGNMKKELKKTTTKGSITKGYFPNVEERLKMKINLTQNVTAIVTGHGKTKAYLHRFKMLEEPTCPCGTAEQTTDHGISECEN